MRTRRIIHTSVSPLVLLGMLARARDALDHNEPRRGGAALDAAIERLTQVRAMQDDEHRQDYAARRLTMPRMGTVQRPSEHGRAHIPVAQQFLERCGCRDRPPEAVP